MKPFEAEVAEKSLAAEPRRSWGRHNPSAHALAGTTGQLSANNFTIAVRRFRAASAGDLIVAAANNSKTISCSNAKY